MIKIDFHIHTVFTKKDAHFNFSLEKLKQYISTMSIDAIAITNHNCFDIDNFNLIKSNISSLVLPGIEIDFVGGHILLISDVSDLEDFNSKCLVVQKQMEQSNKMYLSFDEFLDIFKELNKYIIIPHYEKKPKVQDVYINRLSQYIFNGEVANSNKFVRLLKSNDRLVPVLFSDMRMCEETHLSVQQTYVDVDEISFLSIKEGLKDKTKVFLNKNRNRKLFTILPNGTMASTGLNIIFGKRSSGKTYTLDRIYESFNQNGRVKYIRQFELIEKDKTEAEKKFDEKISSDKSLFLDEYFNEFKLIVKSLVETDIKIFHDSIDGYVKGLLSYAIQLDNLDSFAKVPLFVSQDYEKTSTIKLEQLINSVMNLLESDDYNDIIIKYLDKNKLIALLKELIVKHKELSYDNKVKEKANLIIGLVKKKLSIESGQDPIPSFSFIKYAKTKKDIEKFNELVHILKSEKIILTDPVGKFTIKASRKAITSASILQNIVKKRGTYVEAFSKYNQPGFDYLLAIKDCTQIDENIYYKCFSNIEYQVLNARGYPVSGGERAEYNLEEALKDAEEYDILLIDEPESSFDNIFLREDINERIKTLSTKMPVFVSTHNNVIGGSIKADYIIYTEAIYDGNNTDFKIYSGEFSSQELCTIDGTKTTNLSVLLNSLEGGTDSYYERSNTYASFKNRK